MNLRTIQRRATVKEKGEGRALIWVLLVASSLTLLVASSVWLRSESEPVHARRELKTKSLTPAEALELPSRKRVDEVALAASVAVSVPNVVVPDVSAPHLAIREVAITRPSAEVQAPAAVSAQRNAPVPSVRFVTARRAPPSALTTWSKPGLCTSSEGAASVRETLTAKFQSVDGDEGTGVYFDPRLEASAILPILGYLGEAENVVASQLGLRPARPKVFIYADRELMKAAACINEDAVAFYDGVLHVVAGRADVRQSVIHEYTHHALFSSGMRGPAWAQEGIAMTVAREGWWLNPSLLRGVLEHPFDFETMDGTIPYKLPSQQAVSFYAQSAVTVHCILHTRKWQLLDLFGTLRASANGNDGSLGDALPELEQPAFLNQCVSAFFSP